MNSSQRILGDPALDTKETELSEAQQNYYNDRPRIRTRKAALLDFLRDGRWHPNYELARVGGLSYNSYLYQLRNDGWVIRSRLLKGGIWEQKLVGRTAPRRSRGGLSAPQRQVADVFATAVRKVYGDEGTQRVLRELPPWLQSSSGYSQNALDEE